MDEEWFDFRGIAHKNKEGAKKEELKICLKKKEGIKKKWDFN